MTFTHEDYERKHGKNYPEFYTTPPDKKQCKNYRTDGPTPCWHPHCDCFEAKWDRRMLQLAETASTWSKDPSTKIGCVIVRPDKTVVSLGYNGFPRGMSDATEYYADRETKLSRVVHAEANAILNAGRNGVSVEGCTLYSTLFPCSSCALLIIQAGIKRVVAKLNNEGVEGRWKESFDKTKNFFSEVGIEGLLYP